MRFSLKRNLKFQLQTNVKNVDAVKLWIVTWYSRNGKYSGDIEKEYEAFASEEAANEFVESIKKAYALLRHTSGTEVNVYTKGSDPRVMDAIARNIVKTYPKSTTG